jgi:hypothetical protein
MTIDHWLMIAVIISTLAAPTVAEFAKPRINQPRAKPDTSHPKNLIQRITWWFGGLYRAGWPLPTLVVGLAMISLRKDVFAAGPITRLDVMRISLDCGEIFFGCVIWFIISLTHISKLSSQIVEKQEQMLMEHFAITKGIVGTLFPPTPIQDFEDYDPDQT